jgi:hypothetical protein
MTGVTLIPSYEFSRPDVAARLASQEGPRAADALAAGADAARSEQGGSAVVRPASARLD